MQQKQIPEKQAISSQLGLKMDVYWCDRANYWRSIVAIRRLPYRSQANAALRLQVNVNPIL